MGIARKNQKPFTKDRVLHAHLKVGDADLMISDTFPGQPYQIGSHITIVITMNDAAHTRAVFGKLQDGGQVADISK